MENKTAVQILLDKFQEIHKDFGGLDSEWLKHFNEALELEKQQIIQSFEEGESNPIKIYYESGENYYSKTYKNKDESDKR